MAGIPKISGNSLYFGSPDTPWFSKLNWVWRVSKKWWVAACIGYLLVPEYEYQISLSAIATLVLESPPPGPPPQSSEGQLKIVLLELVGTFYIDKNYWKNEPSMFFSCQKGENLEQSICIKAFSAGSPRLVMKHFFELWGRPIPLGLILCIAIYL